MYVGVLEPNATQLPFSCAFEWANASTCAEQFPSSSSSSSSSSSGGHISQCCATKYSANVKCCDFMNGDFMSPAVVTIALHRAWYKGSV